MADFKYSLAFCAFFLCFVIKLSSQVPFVIKLDSPAERHIWKFVSADMKHSVPASVPGGIYSDLRRHGTLDKDFFWRFNDEEYRWVAKISWSLSRTFLVPAEVVMCRQQILVLHGIDTVADVYLNKQHIGSCENMFVRYTFDLRGKLKSGENKIEIIFTPPVQAAKERYKEQEKKYVVPPKCTPPEYNGECHVNHIRKMQASFSWDWGPAFPSVGAWKSVVIEAYNDTIVRDVMVKTDKNGTLWLVNCSVFWEKGETVRSNILTLTAEVKNKDGVSHKISQEFEAPAERREGLSNALLHVPQEFVELWWPNGQGQQVLYNLSVFLSKEKEKISVFNTKIGFRHVELIQEPVDPANLQKGLTFYLKINSRAVFAKGSNWIPADILPERGNNVTVITHLLHSAKEANMNMLRVWGGGVYESDYFYQLADELGIMIWQDMMFACSMYPTSAKFLESVRSEVGQQFRRLQHHASIVVFAGNNENEAALRSNWYGTNLNFSKYHDDYKKLYVDTVRDTVLNLEPRTVFLVSSPTNGIESEKEDFIAENPYDKRYGDVHTYDYISDGWNHAVYPVVRFSSEYGFQSLPSILTYSQVANPSDLSLISKFSSKRQHHLGGNLEMVMEAARHLPVPLQHDTVDNFPAIVYYTQINQAMSIKTETEALRRHRDVLTEEGLGFTMGALYWQLNDVWQAPTWSSIEYGGRWKMLHYFARNFFHPVLVSPVLINEDILKVVIVSDLQDTLENAVLTISIYRWDSFTPTYSNATQINVKASGTTLAASFSISELLTNNSCGNKENSKENCVVYFEIFDERVTLIGVNFFLPTSPKSASLKTSSIQVVSVSGPTNSTSPFFKHEYFITIDSTYPSLFVWLETTIRGRFSENGYLMVYPRLSVVFFTDASVSSHQLWSSLSVKSLNSV